MRGNTLGNLYAIGEQIESCLSTDELLYLTKKLTRNIGVEYVFAGIMPPKGAKIEEQTSGILFGDWPKEWAKRYFRNRYVDIDPAILHTRSSPSLLDWHDFHNGANFVMNEARAFGLHDGVTVPMHSVDGIKIGMSFAGKHISRSPESITKFQILAAMTTARAVELLKYEKNSNEPACTLSRKELRCLVLVAEGLTNHEIGDVLCLSSKTIEKHISSSLRKTESKNRTHLIYKSLKSGYFK